MWQQRHSMSVWCWFQDDADLRTFWPCPRRPPRSLNSYFSIPCLSWPKLSSVQIWSYYVTPVAGWIWREEIFPNLQARFCKLCPADFSVAIYLFLCSSLSGFVCVSFSSKISPVIFSNRVGRVWSIAKCTGFWRYDPSEQAPRHCV